MPLPTELPIKSSPPPATVPLRQPRCSQVGAYSQRLRQRIFPQHLLPSASHGPICDRMKPLKQVGALCVCKADDEKPLILLVTSRDTGRWVIPKGWPAKRLKAREAAAREAMEEAGVSGKIGTKPIGTYQYRRPHQNGDQLHNVSVYVVAARSAFDHWPEEAQRKRAWFSISTAVRRVAEPELRRLIKRIGTLSNHPKWRCISQLTKTSDRKPKRVTKSATGSRKKTTSGTAVSRRPSS